MKPVLADMSRLLSCAVAGRRAAFTSLMLAVGLFLAAARLAGADPLAPPRAPDSGPKSWSELKIEWKPTWDETLSANGNEAAWKQALDQNEKFRRAADRIVCLRRVWLLEQMIGHFPKERDKCAAACRRISETYMSLGDRTRAAQWLKKLAEDFPERKDRAEAYAGILRCAEPFDAMPAARGWVEYAVHGIEGLAKAGPIPRDHPAAVLARQRAYALLLDESRHEDARRFLDRVDPAATSKRWLPERASLMAMTGHRNEAAKLYEAAGNEARAKELRAGIREASINGIGKRIPRDLEIRWNALEDKRRAGKSVLDDLGLVQETLKLSAETDAVWAASSSHRVLCWLAVDQMLQKLNPADMAPFRELQERTAAPLADELAPTPDANAVVQLFRRYPWSASVHKRLVESGEMSLRADRADEAFRAFQDATTHAADPTLIAQARVGLWFAMTELAEPREALEELMAAVPDTATLSWRGQDMPAAAVKNIMRKRLPASAVALPALSGLRRSKLRLPAALIAADPLPRGQDSAPQGLGALAVRRIEQTDDGLFVFGPRHVACYDAKTMALRWLQVGNKLLDTAAARAMAGDGPQWPEGAWRPISLGSERSRAVAQRRPPRAGESVAPKAVYSLLFHNLRNETQYDVVAFDAKGGEVLWRTMGRREWSGLEPLSEPAAVEGRVYVVAWGGSAGRSCPVYLVCLDGGTGSTVWIQKLGNASLEAKPQKLALLGSAVTIYRGSVYVSTNAGILARCDARDGAVEWTRTYPSIQQSSQRRDQFRREGTSPLVAGERVFVAPRDHSGVIALGRTMGRLLWETRLTPSEQVVGTAGAVLVVRGSGELAGLAIASGRELWTRAIGEGSGARTIIAGPDVFVTSDEKLLRIAAATGATVEKLALDRAPGAAHVLLPDGALVEVSIEPGPARAGRMTHAAKPQKLPLAGDWKLPVDNPRLVLSPAGRGPANTFGVLSGRRFLCVTTKPRAKVIWQTLLRDGADSIGFHGGLVVVARGTLLTALDAASGVTRWSLRLPFQPQVVGGNGRVLFAGELSQNAKAAAINPASGSIHWYRWFGEEARLGGGPLGWISMRHDPANPPALILYWKKALFGKEGWRPGEMVVDAVSGTIQEMRPFLPDEPGWPAHIVFGDSTRTYIRSRPLPLQTYQADFRRDAISFAGNKAAARFLLSEKGTDLAPGWQRTVDLPLERSYPGALGLYATASGGYVKRLQQIFFFDAAAKSEIAYTLPIAPGMRHARTVLALREIGDALTVISQEPGQPIKYDPRHYTIGGLKDNAGKGNVTLQWFTPVAQVYHGTRGLAEAGVSPVATLLDGNTKEHYYSQTMTMRGLSSLGWAKYDVFLYGFTGTATIAGKKPQTCAGLDFKNPIHRTTFIRGVNYVKIAGVTGDSFTLNFTQADFSAVQIVDATASSAPGRKAASLGVNWAGGGIGLGPNDRVGAEVAAGPWYNIGIRNGLTGGYQNHFIFVDVFDRKTGAFRRTQKLPVAARDPRLPGHNRQAAILDDAVVVTDSGNVYLLRTTAP